MSNAKLVTIPLVAHFKLSKDQSSQAEDERKVMDSVPYESAVGSLMYVKGTLDSGLAYYASCNSKEEVAGYVDSDYVGCIGNRRSLIGYVFTAQGTVADRASWYCAVVLLSLILVASVRQSSNSDDSFRGNRFLDRPCDEIYVVGEGETLHTISDKCSDPFIVERNPHIHDPDDVFPGLVIKITPSKRFD
uniref:LysM domain-containing protein n=1 Tax=Cannabis sativa TaxID=3483 RepID=A0A803PQW6_CANSA